MPTSFLLIFLLALHNRRGHLRQWLARMHLLFMCMHPRLHLLPIPCHPRLLIPYLADASTFASICPFRGLILVGSAEAVWAAWACCCACTCICWINPATVS